MSEPLIDPARRSAGFQSTPSTQRMASLPPMPPPPPEPDRPPGVVRRWMGRAVEALRDQSSRVATSARTYFQAMITDSDVHRLALLDGVPHVAPLPRPDADAQSFLKEHTQSPEARRKMPRVMRYFGDVLGYESQMTRMSQLAEIGLAQRTQTFDNLSALSQTFTDIAVDEYLSMSLRTQAMKAQPELTRALAALAQDRPETNELLERLTLSLTSMDGLLREHNAATARQREANQVEPVSDHGDVDFSGNLLPVDTVPVEQGPVPPEIVGRLRLTPAMQMEFARINDVRLDRPAGVNNYLTQVLLVNSPERDRVEVPAEFVTWAKEVNVSPMVQAYVAQQQAHQESKAALLGWAAEHNDPSAAAPVLAGMVPQSAPQHSLELRQRLGSALRPNYSDSVYLYDMLVARPGEAESAYGVDGVAAIKDQLAYQLSQSVTGKATGTFAADPEPLTRAEMKVRQGQEATLRQYHQLVDGRTGLSEPNQAVAQRMVASGESMIRNPITQSSYIHLDQGGVLTRSRANIPAPPAPPSPAPRERVSISSRARSALLSTFAGGEHSNSPQAPAIRPRTSAHEGVRQDADQGRER